MLVLALGFLQVNFLLQVRKVDLAVISMRELDILMKDMVEILSLTTEKDYSVIGKVTLDGVMT